MKKIAILGSTGSIGRQTLDVIDQYPERFTVSVLTCDRNVLLLEQQIQRFQPAIAVTSLECDARQLATKYPGVTFLFGSAGLCQAVRSDCSMVVNALVGMRGMIPTQEALRAGKDVALANKETLVAGGHLIMEEAQRHNTRILPVDSEHSAIFQCLGENPQKGEIKRLILTASGGPFRGYTKEQLEAVTVEEALCHPNWSMGRKITIDSATMMNKGLEIIEAKWLFSLPEQQIHVAVHPQSIIHSMVEFIDDSVLAQLANPDMRGPIGYALGYPERLEAMKNPLDLFGKASNLTFEKPDEETFACMRLARQAIADPYSSYPIVLNAANEVLVQLFLEKKIKFLDIQNNIERMLSSHQPEYRIDAGRTLEIDQGVRQETLRRAVFE